MNRSRVRAAGLATIATLIRSAWTDAKVWRRVPLGPVSFLYRFAKSAPPASADRSPAGREHASETLPPHESSGQLGTVLIVGVGPGFGYGAAEVFAKHARSVALISRNGKPLEELCHRLAHFPAKLRAFPCDATHERELRPVVDEIVRVFGIPDLVVYAVQNSCPGSVLATEVAAFEESWRNTCLGAFIVGRELRDACRRVAPAPLCSLGLRPEY